MSLLDNNFDLDISDVICNKINYLFKHIYMPSEYTVIDGFYRAGNKVFEKVDFDGNLDNWSLMYVYNTEQIIRKIYLVKLGCNWLYCGKPLIFVCGTYKGSFYNRFNLNFLLNELK